MAFFKQISALAIALSAGGGFSQPAAADSRPTRCAAAVATLEAIRGEASKKSYSTASPSSLSETLTPTTFVKAWDGKTPPPGLLSPLKASVSVSALTCEGVRRAAERGGTVLNEGDWKDQLNVMRSHPAITYFYRISLPAIDRSGKHAVVAVLRSSNKLSGDLRLFYLSGWADAG